MTIAIYLRLSIADGDLGTNNKDESNSIENQRLLIRRYIEEDKEMVADDILEYADDGYTGMNFERPGFKRMIADAKTGRFQVLIVKDLSRLGRDYIGVGDYMEQIFPVLGIRFIALNSHYDSNDYVGKTVGLDISLGNLVNHLYCRDISKKVMGALHTKWKQGENPTGIVPFGYRKSKKGEWEIDPEAAKYVRTIFEKAVEGWPLIRIATFLNEQKIPTAGRYREMKKESVYRRKVPDREWLWDTSKVRIIIKNYSYTGAYVCGKYYNIQIGSYKKRRKNESDFIITENAHPAIVTHEEFVNAQVNIKKVGRTEYRLDRGYLLTGKVRCGNCRLTLSFRGKPYDAIMYCTHKALTGKSSQCSDAMYSSKSVECTVWEILKAQMEFLCGLSERLKEQIEAIKSKARDHGKTDKKVECLKAERIRQYEAYAGGMITREKYIEIKSEITKKIEVLQSIQSEKQKQIDQLQELLDALHTYTASSEEIRSSRKLTREMLEVFIDTIYIYDQDKIEVQFTFDDVVEKVMEQLKENESVNQPGIAG